MIRYRPVVNAIACSAGSCGPGAGVSRVVSGNQGMPAAPPEVREEFAPIRVLYDEREARKLGLVVEADGTKLVIRGPKSAEAVASQLLEHKASVLAALPLPEKWWMHCTV